MSRLHRRAALLCGAVMLTATAVPVVAQDHTGHAMAAEGDAPAMWHADLGGGWGLMGMAQLFPIVTVGAPGSDGGPLRETGWYLTQPAVMANLTSPGARWVLRTTLDLEGVTIENGELTPGGWGEGFLDKRHPHTLVHELMLSLNWGSAATGGGSLSAGKGFAPYGTDDPMGRPAVKYPINHHLSQILERWTVNLAVLEGGWSLEGGLFGGAEPEGPYDFSNIESFGDSWSVRVARRLGEGSGAGAEWEFSASHGRVTEEHHGEPETTALWNTALRYAGMRGVGEVYGLLEASMSEPEAGEGTFSVLAEARLDRGGHRPYLRVEVATRPEFVREGAPGTDDFFRYHHGDAPVGATRWVVGTLGYGFRPTAQPTSFRPFVELQRFRVSPERGGVDPEQVFGTGSFWAITAGARIYLGGGPMRMGTYGLLDPMTRREN